jgi:hypothetical protein
MSDPDDLKMRLLTHWIELFGQEMASFPKKKSDQIEWRAMYGNAFWLSGWALMELKEEDNQIEWAELTGDELLTLGSIFADFILTEHIKPILDQEDGIDSGVVAADGSDFEDPESLDVAVERIKVDALSFDSLGYWYFSEENNAYVFYIEDEKLAKKYLKDKPHNFLTETLLPTILKKIKKSPELEYFLKLITAIEAKGYDIALDAG